MEHGELVKEFLGDMPVARFIALYVFALMGMILFFAADIAKAVKADPKTPNKFSWNRLFSKRGVSRIVGNLIVLVVIVLFYGELSVALFNASTPLVLDGFSAIIMGAQSDMLVGKMVGLTRKNGK